MFKKLGILLMTIVAFGLNAADPQLIVIRHGEATSNTQKVFNSDPSKQINLTDEGKKKLEETAKELKNKGINNDNVVAVYVSPFPRAKQTADALVAAGLFSKDKIKTDNLLGELQVGKLEGKPAIEWNDQMAKENGGETMHQVKDRALKFYSEVQRKYPNGNVIVITHQFPAMFLIEQGGQQPDVRLSLGEARVVPLRKTSTPY